MFDHYLGWLFGAPAPGHFQFLDGASYPFARDWGMAVALNDANAVVRKARAKGKREVVLGGHSLGASLTAAYAAWDFNGRPGYKDLDGMVLIDGGLLDTFDVIATLPAAQQAIADLQAGNPFLDLLEVGLPEAAGLFAEIGGIYALKAPTDSATTLQSFPLLPAAFNPPFPVTNQGLLGHAFDRDTSPADLALLHINAGGLAASGDPRDWVDGGVTPLARLAATFGQEPANAVEWYFPRRLTIDTDGANAMVQNDVAELPRPAPAPPAQGRPALLRDPDGPHPRRRPARRAGLRRALEDEQARVDPRQRGSRAGPSRPASGAPRSTMPSTRRWRRSCATRSSASRKRPQERK